MAASTRKAVSCVTSSAAWRAERRATVLKFAGAAAFVVIPFVSSPNTIGRVLGAVAAVGLALFGLRDLLAPVRLAADSDGLTVASGYVGHRRLPWSEIERIRLDSRRRLGSSSEFLEVDAGSSLYFFSRYDLGVDPSEVLEVIEAIRRDAS
jgi:hypothetical protein